jgi:hypothetical protein
LKPQAVCVTYQAELFDVTLHRDQGPGTGIVD